MTPLAGPQALELEVGNFRVGDLEDGQGNDIGVECTKFYKVQGK